MGMYRARAGQSALRRGGASIVVPFWSSQTWYPELLELANDIVNYAPDFVLFLPGDTGSSRAVGPPLREFWLRTSCRAHLVRTASYRPRLER